MSDNDLSYADPLGRIADEFVEAFRQGKRPSVEEFAHRYPEHADEILDMLPALVLMEKARESSGPRRPAAPAAALQQLGDYQILREVGRGGMGVVYEAQQISLGRHVAIKVLPSYALLDPKHLGRFQREARSAAKLHHTNIVPVFGVGEQDGMYYYVMQFIPGLGLDVVLDELRRLRQLRGKAASTQGGEPGLATPRTRYDSAGVVARTLLSGEFRQPVPGTGSTLPPGKPAGESDLGAAGAASSADTSTIHLPGQKESSSLSESSSQYWLSVARVGMQVADALAHAASQGVLHRDIKPSNLLIDDTGNVWVTDFGLAKAASDSDDLTHTGDVVGTLRYMAPERFSGQGDVRSDVYSLGLTLYEMLALRPAFDEPDRNKLIAQVLHDEPVRPRRINKGVPRDLETVVLKAIARDPEHRYQTPADMAEDLKRFVEDRPVRARRSSGAERLWRWGRRNPLPASLLAGILVVFLAGFAGVFWQWREAEAARQDETTQRNRAETARDEARRRETEAVAARDDAKQTRNAAARQAAGLLLDRGIEDARGGEPARALHLFVRALRALPAHDPKAAPLERVIRANLSAWAETVPAVEHVFPTGPQSDNVAFTRDGEVIAMAVGKDEIQCFRTRTGRPVGPPVKIPVGTGAAMAFSADGRSLWAASPGIEKVVDQWNVHRLGPASGRPIDRAIPSAGPVLRLIVTPDGRYLVGAVLGLHPDDRGPAPNADGSRKWRTASIVVWDSGGRLVRKVDVNSESEIGLGLPDACLSLSPDGKSVTAGIQRGPKRYEVMTFTVSGKEPPIRHKLPALGPRAVWMLHFRDNLSTALAIKDGQLHRWLATNPGVLGPGVPTPFPSMHDGPSADGRSVVSPIDGRVFDTGAWPPRPSGVRFAHPGWQRHVNARLAQSPDGRFAVTWIWGSGGGGRLWRLPRPHSRPALPAAEVARQPKRPDYHQFAQFDPSRTSAILWAYQDLYPFGPADAIDDVRVVDVTDGAVRGTSVRHSALVREIAFTPDGRHFATASFDATARVWETATGRPAGPPLPHTNYVATVAFSPDGNTLAAGDFGPAGLIKLWDWRRGKEVKPPLRHDDIILNVSFSPDGRYLAASKTEDWSKNPELLVWELSSARAVIRKRDTGPGYMLLEMARFRPDSRAVTKRDMNGFLHLWEAPSGKLLGERPLDGHGVTRFSPDGRVVAAAANLGVRLLDGNTLAPLEGGYLPHPDQIIDVAFSPDGAFLLTAHETGSAQLWDLATRKPVGPPAVLLGPIRAVAFTPDGKTCLAVSADGTVRRWPAPAPFVEPDLTRLADRVALMTGQRMDDNQGLDSVPLDEWRSLRAKLVGDGSTALVRQGPDADWHDSAAADAEQDQDAIGAEWHLERLAVLRPNDWTIPARRGRVLAAVGRQDEAAAAYAAARRLAPSPGVLSDWLRARAADDEAAGRKKSALWNLDRAIALTPDDWTLYVLRAGLADPARAGEDFDKAIRRGAEPIIIVRAVDKAAQSGDWKRAAALLNSLARTPALSTQGRYLQAVANLKAGDPAGYRAACAGIAERLPPVGPKLTPLEANGAAMAFALGANATDDWTKPLAWIDSALAQLAAIEKLKPELKEQVRQARRAYVNTRCAVLYRAGRFKESAKGLRQIISRHPDGGDFHDWLFLALAEHRLDHSKAAKEAAAKARAAQSKARRVVVWEVAEVELLAEELAAALPGPGK